MYSDSILDLINEGDEMEMPRGVAVRLNRAGFKHPVAVTADENLKFIEEILLLVFVDENVDEYSVNEVAASRLTSAGVKK